MNNRRTIRALRDAADQLERGVEAPKAIAAASGKVDSDYLLQNVINVWGYDVLTYPVYRAPGTPPPPPPPPTGLTAAGTQKPSGSSVTIANKAIVSDDQWGFGIAHESGTLGLLTLTNLTIRSVNYCLYSAGCGSLNATGVDAKAGTGGNDYAVRGVFNHWESTDCRWANDGDNKACFRVYDCFGGFARRDYFGSDRVMLGGGYSVEWDLGASCGEFKNFLFDHCRIDAHSVEIYSKTHDVVFDTCDFTGTDHISIQPGAFNITFKNCTGLTASMVRRYNGSSFQSGPDATRGITIF